MVDGAVVPDLTGLTEHDAHAVIDEQASADGGTGVDLDAGAAASVLADPAGKEKVPVLIKPVGNAVVNQDMEAGIQQDDLQHTACGGVLALDVPCVLQ